MSSVLWVIGVIVVVAAVLFRWTIVDVLLDRIGPRPR
jgi:hypothetical protein